MFSGRQCFHKVEGVMERVDLGRSWGELGSEYDQNRLCDVFREWKLYIIKSYAIDHLYIK